jgi:hypothetical protein
MEPKDRFQRPRNSGEEPQAWPSLTPRDEAATWFSRGVGFVGGGLLAYGVVNGFIGASSVVLLLFFALLLGPRPCRSIVIGWARRLMRSALRWADRCNDAGPFGPPRSPPSRAGGIDLAET